MTLLNMAAKHTSELIYSAATAKEISRQHQPQGNRAC